MEIGSLARSTNVTEEVDYFLVTTAPVIYINTAFETVRPHHCVCELQVKPSVQDKLFMTKGDKLPIHHGLHRDDHCDRVGQTSTVSQKSEVVS